MTVHPRDQISLLVLMTSVPLAVSGAIQQGVPPADSVFWLSLTLTATPKSAILILPSLVMRMLRPLMSLCAMFSRCRQSSPSRIWKVQSLTSASGKTDLLQRVPRVPPQRYSRMRQILWSLTTASRYLTMFLWLRFLMKPISFFIDFTSSLLIGISFIATIPPVVRFIPLYTRPFAPLPIVSIIWQESIMRAFVPPFILLSRDYYQFERGQYRKRNGRRGRVEIRQLQIRQQEVVVDVLLGGQKLRLIGMLYNSSIKPPSMKYFLLSLLLLLCLLSPGRGQVQYLQFSVDPVVVSRANFYLNQLATQVQTYNWINCNRLLLSNTLQNTLIWLRQIRNALPTGNVLDGSGNAVSGTNNVVVGNRNRVKGANSWVFVSNYRMGEGVSTFLDSVLAIGNYQIDLTKADQVAKNPPNAITMIDSNGYDNLCSKNVATSFFFKN